MRERDVESYFKQRVALAGGTTRKFVSPGHPNVPDQIVIWRHDCDACRAATIHFVELKAPGKKLRPAQEREAKRLRALGCTVRCFSTKEQVDQYVKEENECAGVH